MKIYKLIKTIETNEDGEKALSYGIANKNIYCKDISTDKEAVEIFLAEINSVGNVEECLLWNLIEDNFGE